MFCSIFVPTEGNVDIDAGDGVRGDHLGPQKSQKITKDPSYDNCSHFWDIFPKISKNLKKSLKKSQKQI